MGDGKVSNSSVLQSVTVTAPSTPTPTPIPSPTASPAPAPTGRTLYMSPTGSDGASGSITAPFRSLRYWTGTLRPGDTVLVRGGSYHEPGAGNIWQPTVSGTAAAPITVKAYPGEVPVFDGDRSGMQSFVLSGVSYIVVDGLTFTRYAPNGNGVLIISNAHHITVRNITMSGNVGVTQNDHDVYISHGSSDIVIDRSRLDGMPGAAVHIYSADDYAGARVTITNNRITNSGWGILAESNLAGGTFQDNVLDGNSIALKIAYTTGVDVSHNIIRGSVGMWIEGPPDIGTGSSPITESYNCIDAPVPFRVRWPVVDWTLAQWQTTGQGAGDTVGTCP